jgi:hypothetical protein
MGIQALAADLPQVWHAPSTTAAGTCSPPPPPDSLKYDQWITRLVRDTTSIGQLFKDGHAVTERITAARQHVNGLTPVNITTGSDGGDSSSDVGALLRPILDEGIVVEPQATEPEPSAAGAGQGTGGGACTPGNAGLPENPAEGGGEWVDPQTINFSQRTVSPHDYVELMRQGQWDWNRPGGALRVIDVGGQLVSYDNRRLDAAREVGGLVRVQRVNPGDPFPDSTAGKTWWDKFKQRFNDPRNLRAGGCVPDTGLYERPDWTSGK